MNCDWCQFTAPGVWQASPFTHKSWVGRRLACPLRSHAVPLGVQFGLIRHAFSSLPRGEVGFLWTEQNLSAPDSHHYMRFDIGTGICPDAPSWSTQAYPVRIRDGMVEVGL